MLVIVFTGIAVSALAQQRPIKEYWPAIKEQEVNMTGGTVRAITVNDSIPAPTLYFTEDDSAVIVGMVLIKKHGRRDPTY